MFAGYHRMHHGALAADPGATKLAELVLVSLNAAELQRGFVEIHAATARMASASDDELVEAIVCAIRVVGVAAWAAGAEGLFPDAAPRRLVPGGQITPRGASGSGGARCTIARRA